jgi:hypothetical protein
LAAVGVFYWDGHADFEVRFSFRPSGFAIEYVFTAAYAPAYFCRFAAHRRITGFGGSFFVVTSGRTPRQFNF